MMPNAKIIGAVAGAKKTMNAKRQQRGFINLPEGFFETLLVLAALGFLALACIAGWALWWLVTHVRFVA